MTTVRLFVAVSISDQARNALADLIKNLENNASGVRWVKPTNLHLTMKFLGDVAGSKISNLKEALDLSVVELNPFRYELKGVGCFPNYKRPRVVWIGVEDFSKQLVTLQENIEEQFLQVNIPKEKRKFHPHLTVARIKDNKKINPLLAGYQNYNFGPFTNDVSEVLLMKSELRPSGAEYTCLHKTKII